MIFGYLILFIAVTISAIAAYYSVAGLTAIFAAAVMPVIVMGGALEAGKIVATVWLHNNWRRAGWAFKSYLIPAIVFLMLLTSMGIFGFLSKAHSDQSLVSGDVQSKIAIYDEKIKTARENIEADRKQLKQMDEAVDQVMARSTSEEGATKANNIRRSQQRDRTALAKDIEANQKLIAKLNDESAPIRAEVRKVEAEVGPIKYIAALVYGDNPDSNLLERAVRWVIILIVIVFDPLALCLILAANKQIEWAIMGRGGWVHDQEDEKSNDEAKNITDTPPPPVESAPEPTVEPPAETPLDEEVREAEEEQKLKNFFWRGRMIARALDADEAERLAREGNQKLAELDPPEAEVNVDEAAAEHDLVEEQRQLLETSAAVIEELKNEIAVKEQSVVELTNKLEHITNHSTSVEGQRNEDQLRIRELEGSITTLETEIQNLRDQLAHPVVEEMAQMAQALQERLEAETAENTKLAEQRDQLAQENQQLKDWLEQVERDLIEAVALAKEKSDELKKIADEQAVEQLPEPVVVDPQDFAVVADNQDQFSDSKATFGTEFPKDQTKGDMFLRVDYLPPRLFKWNGIKWIEIDKNSTDRFAYDADYVKHLVAKLQSGEYDLDDLNETERQQVNDYLKTGNA